MGAEGVTGWVNYLFGADLTQCDLDPAVKHQRLGRPSHVQGLARSRGQVWSYRYENHFCQWFQVDICMPFHVEKSRNEATLVT